MEDGWYRVVKVRPYVGFFDQPVHGNFSDMFLRRLGDDEAAVREVMES